jgi:hypothetical protein
MYRDYQDPMYKSGQVFSITPLHVLDADEKSPTIHFLAYINDFSENYDSNWSEEDVFGRMDGIHNFSSVKRTFNISLRIAAESFAAAKNNMIKISKMIKFLYPAVGKNSHSHGQNVFENFYIRSAPIFKIKFGNIINSRYGDGLHGIIKGSFSIKPLHEHGWFIHPLEGKEKFVMPDSGKAIALQNIGNATLGLGVKPADPPPKKASLGQSYDIAFYYKYVDISFTFTVIHDHMLGSNPDVDQHTKDSLKENAYFKEFFPYLVYDRNKTEREIMSIRPFDQWEQEYRDALAENEEATEREEVKEKMRNLASQAILSEKLKKLMLGR